MRRPWTFLVPLAAALAAVGVACGSGGTTDEVPDGGSAPASATLTSTERPAPSLRFLGDDIPPLDVTRSIVPLDGIIFDTFDGRSVSLPDANDALIENLRDTIPPLDQPVYEGVEGGDWLQDGDLVLTYVTASGEAYAYPHKILNFHEIVNDEFDGVPVLISYCPLCRSGVVYDRRLDDRTLTFGNTSALFDSDLVMYDFETNSYWWQVAGRAIVGTLSGKTLTPLPSATMTWGAWKRLHPETRILSRETGFIRDYERDPFVELSAFLDSGRTPFPVTDNIEDDRLRPSDEVLGVVVGDANKAYPLRRLGDAAVNDVVGGRRVVIFSSAEGPAGAVFFAEVAMQDLTFAYRDGSYRDDETGSTWDLGGRAVAGPLEGARLESPPSLFTFWFAYVAAFPDAGLFQ